MPYLPPSIEEMSLDFKKGVKTGESCRISDLEPLLCWMTGFLRGLTGLPNQGKSTLELFLMLVKSVIDGKKWVIWSPEMIISIKKKDKSIKRSASHLYNILIHAHAGENPYKHKPNQMSFDKWLASKEFIQEHFYIIDTERDNKPETVINEIREHCKEFPIYGWLVDPFKNLDYDGSKGTTTDRVLRNVLDEFKLLAMETNTCGTFVLHPKSMKERDLRKNGTLKGPYKVITQHDLLGGSIWDHSLDSIHSYYRQNIHDDRNSPDGSLYCLRQKMQEITNKCGEYDQIYFDDRTGRFYFNGVCPIDGSRRVGTQADIKFNPFDKKKKEEKVPLPQDPPF